MNKFNFLKKLSLTEQVICIFALLSLLTYALIMPLNQRSIRAIMEKEVFTRINTAQGLYINFNYEPEEGNNTQNIYSMSYDIQTDEFHYLSETTTTDHQYEALIEKDDVLKDFIISGKEVGQFSVKMNKSNYVYYQIKMIGKSKAVITYMPGLYSNEFYNKLNRTIILEYYLFIIMLAAIIVAWVSTLLFPLYQIKRYINKLKEGKEAKLNIHRKDEIGVVADSLVTMKKELDEQEKIKEEMTHNISHDLKTPIALIKVYTEGIRDGVYPYGSEKESIDIILENCDRLEKKVSDLLHLNRLDFLSSEEINSTTDMKLVIEDVIKGFTFMHPDILVDLELNDVSFKGIEEYWRICVENIVDNAYRYVDKRIHIVLKEDYLEIYNDGEPIAEDKLQSIFNPYEKGEKGKFGLGMSIVKKTVNAFKYKVKAVNQEVGVSFIITK